jgi:hypothetical protein
MQIPREALTAEHGCWTAVRLQRLSRSIVMDDDSGLVSRRIPMSTRTLPVRAALFAITIASALLAGTSTPAHAIPVPGTFSREMR